MYMENIIRSALGIPSQCNCHLLGKIMKKLIEKNYHLPLNPPIRKKKPIEIK
jgi:hypothetical protein